MKKTIYIIPGWEENPSLPQYESLAKKAKDKGYDVNCKNVDWKKPLSKQIFNVSKEAVIFGFSLGAILGRMVAQNSECKHLILASSAIVKNLSEGEDRKAYIDLLGKDFVEDIIKNIKETNNAEKQTVLYGELENEKADIIVPNTEHELSNEYIKLVSDLL